MQTKIQTLENEIRLHNKLYFIDNNPKISDEEFDKLVEELKCLDPKNPTLFELVGKIGDVKHETPMLSIEKRYSYEDIQKWLIDTGDKKYIIEPKYDGMAAKYQNGVLSTRGNGLVGEDISGRLKNLNIIGKLPKKDEVVLGEIIIPLSYFNKNLASEYKNPRNAVVGIVKSKRVADVGIKALMDKGVHFIIYDEANSRKVNTESLLDKDEWEAILEETLQVDYPLDGIVIKASDNKIRNKLTATAHHEKWQIAYKLPAERKWSKVLDIKSQVGRTGRITNVAVIESIELSGATVKNVTLHNINFVEKTKIGVGSKVEVCRSGEVIPFITNVKPSSSHFKIPTNCPACKSKLERNGKYLECNNLKCPARTSQEIEHFFKALNVQELGLKTIEKFMNIFEITSPIEFYDLKVEQITPLEGFGDKSANNIVSGIRNTLEGAITEHELLEALGVRDIGKASSKWILKNFGFGKLNMLTKEDLQGIKGIGPNKAESFVKDIKEKWKVADALLKKGIRFKTQNASNKLAGLTFCITGKKEKYSREELIKIIEQSGGEYAAALTKSTNYLIAGENAGSKLQKAKELNIKVISEKDLLSLIT
ncbi:NAD-dependent DNA ligase LigA [candidate division WWE3 bacterium CG_4_9_14_0_2_um_filter_35_11]|uniref:DNA ligase n=1 Tax=candidate division WWE3 bacterium CG_4_9_14_0_2_um_filter_35_11 TaxID=1975077 RepID=A0A2M8ELK2_UNCKA|nr:MAG: NAD-dependent DNA ligase LigA [candidate division WWE3 bacterium CG10_big_fil_rev_8_21_14_0_10_35_32]PJC23608.1 MAG: NAD-dependent DNA ligase LigA [candidate division WWE3 bacterium CG_4_9_14_0_2_um_filter_35_11]